MRDNTERFDIVVVGAGLAGLIAGTLAARGGARTLVVDAHPAGGRARTTDRNGFLFNEGPHALYAAGALLAVLRRLGVEPSGGQPVDYHAACGGAHHPLPTGPVGLAQSPLLSARGKLAAASLFRRLPTIDTSTLAGCSVVDWCDELALPGSTRALLLMLIRVSTYADAPGLLDAGAAVAQLQAATSKGVRYLDGGWQTLIRRLSATLTAAGGELRTGEHVDSVSSDGWTARVQTGDEVLLSGAVIVAGLAPAEVSRLLGERPDWLGDLGPPVEAACLQLGVARPPRPSVVFGIDRPLYLSAHAPVARLAPAGRAMVEVMKYLPPGHTAQVVEDRAELVDFRRRGGIDDADVLEERFLPRMTVGHAMPLARRGGLAGRPPVDAPGTGNVFVAGDWVGATGMLSDASAASAQAAAGDALAVVALVGAAR